MNFNKASFKSSAFATLITLALFGVLSEGALQSQKIASKDSQRGGKMLLVDGPVLPPQLPGPPPKQLV